MGQDISIKLQMTSTNRSLSMEKNSNAKYSPINSAVEFGKILMSLAGFIRNNFKDDYSIEMEHGRDFEPDVYIWEQGSNTQELVIQEDDYEKRIETPEWWVEPTEGIGKKMFIKVYDSYFNEAYFKVSGFNNNECKAIAEHIERNFKYIVFGDEVLIDSEWVLLSSLHTETQQNLGVVFEFSPVEIPTDIQDALSIKTFSYGNEPDGKTYFGIGNKSITKIENDIVHLWVRGEVSAYCKNGEKFLFVKEINKTALGAAIVYGKVNLKGWTLATTNELFDQEFIKWLKANDYAPFGANQGIGNKTTHWFHMGYPFSK